MESWHQMSMHHQSWYNPVIYSSLSVNCLCFKVNISSQKQTLKVFAQNCSPKHQRRSSLPFIMFSLGIIPCLFKGNKSSGKRGFLEGGIWEEQRTQISTRPNACYCPAKSPDNFTPSVPMTSWQSHIREIMNSTRPASNTGILKYNGICFRLHTPALKRPEKLLMLFKLIFLSRFLGILPLLYHNSNTLYFPLTKLQRSSAT